MAARNEIYTNAARPRAPGVYIEEVTPESPPAFRTGVPVFVGFAAETPPEPEQGIDWEANFCKLTRWEQFAERVGRAAPGSFLAYAVRGFFENGGESCVVVPLRQPARRFATLTNVFSPGGLLESVEDVDLVCVPDILMEDFRWSRELVFELQRRVLEHCQKKSRVLEHCQNMGDRFAILDTLPRLDVETGARAELSLTDMGGAIEHWQELLPTDGALYFPWIRVEPLPPPDQHSRAEGRLGVLVPPCGHVAGIYARTDARIGVHKAPANEIVEGAWDVETQLTDEDQGRLNDVGVNCIRNFPGRGLRVWGARTLSGLPPWKYVNVRRLFLTLVRWIERHMHDLVFEPNGPPLWDRLSDRLGAYCYEMFRRGALKGRRPAEAFFVKCDAETNPLEVQAAGQLICEVGLAPVRPAEFIVVRITQSAAGTAATIPAGA
jgi:hypothetical protein